MKKLFNITYILLGVFAFNGVVLAESSVKIDQSTTTATSTISKNSIKKIVKKIALEDRKTCEVYADIAENITTLAGTTEAAQNKLQDLKNTLEDEIVKRDTFVDGLKSLFSLKKSDVSVLSGAKMDVEEAEVFYKDLDEKVASEGKYLDENSCEEVIRKDLISRYNRVESFVKEEDKYRKDLAKKLKVKMQVLVKEVETKKEKTKE